MRVPARVFMSAVLVQEHALTLSQPDLAHLEPPCLQPAPLWCVAENYRSMEAFLRLRDAISSGQLGAIVRLDMAADLGELLVRLKSTACCLTNVCVSALINSLLVDGNRR